MQIFSRSINRLPFVGMLVLVLGGLSIIWVIWYYCSPKHTQVGYAPKQPIPYSHRLHAGELGIDCLYCHANAEKSAVAMIPPTQTCMNCHAAIKTDSHKLALVRESWETGKPIEWIRVHRLPEHAYFDHSVHVTAGVGCSDCHGRIDQMEVVRQDQPLSMGWCLDCHRDPGPHLRPRDQITVMDWHHNPSTPTPPVRPVSPPQQCSGCHR
ncbi:cytochrome c3 family protein [Pajaroellobacter abortibovis]|uniref:Cytochrome C n=1 Tax=Pajaroellobacter abortibovis TaxID=1882918 RepID=A0A1L6MV94_9BACT|nr:cytochrome c3 family protein [Pajaroellobacter abortibovis]APR99440.1 cytochrome C [Pajaroellobacter abortibovis]